VQFAVYSPRGAADAKDVIKIVRHVKPALVTVVHCDTPTGILNDLTGIGSAVREVRK
jgi:aspartate aminotransferase-like enzyme